MAKTMSKYQYLTSANDHRMTWMVIAGSSVSAKSKNMVDFGTTEHNTNMSTRRVKKCIDKMVANAMKRRMRDYRAGFWSVTKGGLLTQRRQERLNKREQQKCSRKPK